MLLDCARFVSSYFYITLYPYKLTFDSRAIQGHFMRCYMSFKESMRAFGKAYKNEWSDSHYEGDSMSTLWDIFLLIIIVVCIIAILAM